MIDHKVKLSDYIFDESIETQIKQLDYAKELWPLVYLLTDSEKDIAYVGETTDVISRLQSHRRNKTKQKLNQVHLITSDLFNKSATLDIESNLIRYLSADQNSIFLMEILESPTTIIFKNRRFTGIYSKIPGISFRQKESFSTP